MNFSVIIPTYNRSHLLNRAITSVLQQSYHSLELLIIDDGSTDSTDKILAKIQDPRLKIIKLEKNSGVSTARNIGIRNARYSWLAFLDSDDEWWPTKLEEQSQFIHKNPNLRVIHSDEIWIRNGKRHNPRKIHKKHGGRIFKSCIPLCCISPSTVVVHKSIFEDVGDFNPNYPACEDYDLWLRICAKFEVGFIPHPLITKYGGHEDQLSKKYTAMDYWRVKSLFALTTSPNITPEEHKELINAIHTKCKILLNGYKKHNNMKNFSEISNIFRATS